MTFAASTAITCAAWLNPPGPVTVRSALDGRVTNDGVARYRGLDGRHLADVRLGVCGQLLTLTLATRLGSAKQRNPPRLRARCHSFSGATIWCPFRSSKGWRACMDR